MVNRTVRVFFRYVFAVTWGLGLVGLIVPRLSPGAEAFSRHSPFYWAAGYAISLIGIAMTAFYDGRSGLRALVHRLLPWKARLHWYVIVLGGYAVITVAALYAARSVGAAPASMPGLRALLVGVALTLLLDVGPLGEELGWRGFALPRLLETLSPLRATILLGIVHAVWHVPLFFISGLPQGQVSFPVFAVGVISIAVMDTWLYLRSGANLLLAILVHLMANYCGGILGAPAFPFFIGAEATAALAIVAFGGLRPAPALSVAVDV
jgi:membrane protease YdiL (CAAX protease family)